MSIYDKKKRLFLTPEPEASEVRHYLAMYFGLVVGPT